MNEIHRLAIVSPHARFYTTRLVVGRNTRIDDGCIITGNVEIGDYVHIAANCLITGTAGVVIGNYTGIAAFTSILTATDDFSGRSMVGPTVPTKYRKFLKRGQVIIGRNVIVGSHSVVMPGIVLNDGCGIGAHSLVKQDCDADTLYGGVPAKKIKPRSQDVWTLTREFESELAENGE